MLESFLGELVAVVIECIVTGMALDNIIELIDLRVAFTGSEFQGERKCLAEQRQYEEERDRNDLIFSIRSDLT